MMNIVDEFVTACRRGRNLGALGVLAGSICLTASFSPILAIGASQVGQDLHPSQGAVGDEPQENIPEIGSWASPNGEVSLHVVTAPKPQEKIPLNKLISLNIKLSTKLPEGAARYNELVFDARMPEHAHGMVVKPRVKRLNANEFRVDGVKLHMGGAWELSFKLKEGEKVTEIRVPYQM